MIIPKVHAVRPSSDWRKVAAKGETERRFAMVYAQAIGELRRMTGMKPGPDGTVDVLKLDRALAGQPVDRRLRLKSMLAECGMIPNS